MKHLLSRLLASVVLAWACLSSAGAAELNEAALAGHYWLKNVREVGGELLLRPDASFEWSLTYGAIDQFAQGKWRLENGKVVLQAATPQGSPRFRLFEEDELNIRKPAEPGSWVAIVGMPRVGPAAGMAVMFESASGKQWQAVSDRSGDAIVQVPASEAWARAGLRRQGDSGEWQWFAIPAARAEARLAAFAIDDISQIAPQPFQRMTLLPVAGTLQSEDGGLVYSR